MSRIALDALALVVYLVASLPAVTGISVHEWIGLGFAVVLVVHLAQHFDMLLKPTGHSNGVRIARMMLSICLAISLMTVVVSGVMMSGSVLGTLGYYAEGYYFWNPLHAISAKVLLALVLIHLFVNVPTIKALTSKWLEGKQNKNSAA